MKQLWQREAPGMERCSIRAQLLALPRYLDDEDLARSAVATWWSLTRACHHHAYELPPTESELARWMSSVEAFASHN